VTWLVKVPPTEVRYSDSEAVHATELKRLSEWIGYPAPLHVPRRGPVVAATVERTGQLAPAVSSSSMTIPMRRQGRGIIGGADDISVDRTALAVDAAKHAEKQGFKQAINDFRRPGYCGPCPRGHVPHHCHFRLLAISFDHFSMRKA